MNNLSFNSPRIIYYGPHQCDNCGSMVCKMGREFGGNTFSYPEGPIYPNTEWHPHVCDPELHEAKTPQPSFEPPPEPTPLPPRPPFETFKRPTCKGCYLLGNGCGSCEKCVWERAQVRVYLAG